MTTNYFSNFDDSGFKNNKPREFNKLIDDGCDIAQRNYSNDKALKFVTTTHRDLLDAKSNMNYFGIDIKDQLFTPSNLMDDESKLKLGVTGGQLTNCKVRNEFGELPLPTMPSRYQLYHGDVDVEDSIRNYIEQNRKSCNPKDNEFYNRSFYSFNGIEAPDATKSVENNIRCGVSTRYPVPLNKNNVTVKDGKNYKQPVDMLNIKPAIRSCNVFPYSGTKC